MDSLVVKAIRKKIETIRNEESADTKLLTEASLAKELGVDRHSIRRAIQKCTKIGMLHPIRGKGYALNIDEVVVDISRTTNYTDIQVKQKKKPQAEIIDYSLVKPNAILSDFFDAEQHERVWLIHFKRFNDEIPISTTRSFLPFIDFEDLNVYLNKNHSLHTTLKERYKVHPMRIWSTCEAETATKHVACILQIPSGFPVLKVCSVSKKGNEDKIIEYCETYFRSDLVKLKFNIETLTNP